MAIEKLKESEEEEFVYWNEDTHSEPVKPTTI